MKHYTIIFNTSMGSRRSIRINNPNSDLPVEDISAAVDQILENDIYDPMPRGSLDSLNRMELTVIERTNVL